jgi:hypothetical protein
VYLGKERVFNLRGPVLCMLRGGFIFQSALLQQYPRGKLARGAPPNGGPIDDTETTGGAPNTLVGRMYGNQETLKLA